MTKQGIAPLQRGKQKKAKGVKREKKGERIPEAQRKPTSPLDMSARK